MKDARPATIATVSLTLCFPDGRQKSFSFSPERLGAFMQLLAMHLSMDDLLLAALMGVGGVAQLSLTVREPLTQEEIQMRQAVIDQKNREARDLAHEHQGLSREEKLGYLVDLIQQAQRLAHYYEL